MKEELQFRKTILSASFQIPTIMCIAPLARPFKKASSHFTKLEHTKIHINALQNEYMKTQFSGDPNSSKMSAEEKQ